LNAALTHPSPNFGERRNGADPRLVVIHYTAMPDAGAALARLCDPSAEVSCHWLIGADGALASLVAEEMRAWHAGAGAWGGCSDVNSASIGIELDNDGASPFPEAQMAALEVLLDRTMARWGIPPEGVIAHSDMAPGRKRDPGPRFDWRRLAAGGRAVWPEPAGKEADLFRALAAIGYPVGDGEAAVLASFRSRFRPGAAGPADAVDARLAADLARRFPVDRTVPSA
jgi:N-acetylmuramoyl-L-alanine amidase